MLTRDPKLEMVEWKNVMQDLVTVAPWRVITEAPTPGLYFPAMLVVFFWTQYPSIIKYTSNINSREHLSRDEIHNQRC